MTDGRIPGKWMSDPRFIEMSTDTWTVLTKALTWSNEAGTDGRIKTRYLAMLHPDGDCPDAYDELVKLGLWSVTADGFQFVDWAKPSYQGGLGQSTAEQVRLGKERSRASSAAYRAKQAAESSVTDSVSGHVTNSTSGHVGHDKTRDALTQSDHLQSAHAREEEPPPAGGPTDEEQPPEDVEAFRSQLPGWDTAPIGQSNEQPAPWDSWGTPSAEKSVYEGGTPFGNEKQVA